MLFNKSQKKEKFLTGTVPPKKRNIAWHIFLVSGALIALGSLISVVWVKLEQTAIKANTAKVQSLLPQDRINALVLAIHTAGKNKRLTNIIPRTNILTPVKLGLRQAVYTPEKSALFQQEESIHSVAFGANDREVIVSSDGNGIRLWSDKGTPISQLLPGQNVTQVIYSPEGETIAVVIDRRTIRLLDRNGNYLETFHNNRERITALTFSPNGKYLVSGNEDKILRLWDLEGNLILTFRGHESEIDSVAFSPDGQNILSGSHNDGTIRLWDLNGQLLETFSIGKNILTSFTFSPDGKTIVIGSRDGEVRLWDINGKLLKTLSGHNQSVSSVAFNPDGQTFVSSSLDTTIRLWTKDGILLQILQGHEEEVQLVAFSSDGKQIISSSKDGTVRLWQGGNWEDWLSEGCNQLQNHPVLKNPKTREAKGAKHTCRPYMSTNIARSRVDKAVPTNISPDETPKVTETPKVAETPEVTEIPQVTPEDFEPKAKAAAKHYHHRGSELADTKLIEKYTKIVENPNTSTAERINAYINRGVIYFRDTKYEQAIESYTKALDKASQQQLIQIYVNRGMAYSSLPEPKYELAIEDYNQAINLAPEYFDAYVNRGIAFSSLGQYKQAMKDYSKAIYLNPDNPDVHYARGFTLALQENKQQEAIEAYRQAADLYQKQGKEEYAQNARKKIEELQN
ncbi:MAG: tetratricopeptide repeat protein [Xenococcaceae cyanobacterium MO_188.B32]|nr:tetratricopeptide repeat protein [Xenococcaceae cyanobacterium MO_188.B32]